MEGGSGIGAGVSASGLAWPHGGKPSRARPRLLAVALGWVLLAAAEAAPASIYYVAPAGNDSNPGTEALPWRTIQKAADTLQAGDTVLIRAGTYNERVIPQFSGTAGLPITYSAYPGESPVLDGTGIAVPTDEGLFHVVDRQHLRVIGLRIVHSAYAGIYADMSGHLLVHGNSTFDTVSSGIGIWGSTDVTIEGNRVEESNGGGWQECITVAGTDTFTVRDNEVLDCHKEGICLKDGSAHGQVYRNRTRRTDSGGLYVDAWDKHTHDIDLFQNVVRETLLPKAGIGLSSEQGGLLEDVRVYYDKEVDRTIRQSLTLFGPIMLLVLASVFVLMALAYYLPLFRLLRLIPGTVVR